jgi:hypothetical protein
MQAAAFAATRVFQQLDVPDGEQPLDMYQSFTVSETG